MTESWHEAVESMIQSERPWTGPRASDLTPDGAQLRHPVPPERWPFCMPDEHESCCTLHEGGLFCDCDASDEGSTR